MLGAAPFVRGGQYRKKRRAVLSPAAALAAFTLVAAALHTSRALVFTYRNSHFFGDDFDVMWLSHTRPIGPFLFTAYDEHFVPLQLLVARLADAVAPMSFGFALLIAYGVHVVGLVYAYRVLALLERRLATPNASEDPSPRTFAGFRTHASWVLFGILCSYVYRDMLFVWWSGGLGRLFAIALTLIAIHCYLSHRSRPTGRSLAGCFLVMLAGLGFHAKFVLVPLYLAALELCFWKDTPAPDRLRHLRLVAALGLVSMAYVAFWRSIVPAERQALNTDLAFQLRYVGVSLNVLVTGLLGSIDSERAGIFSPAHLAWALALAAVAYTSLRRPSNLFAWAGLLVVLSCNVLLTSLSKARSGAFGLGLAFINHRYYYELVPLLVIGCAIPFYRAARGAPLDVVRYPALEWCAAVLCMLGLAVVISNSDANATLLFSNFYARHAQTRAFVRRVAANSLRILRQDGHPLCFVDGAVPRFIHPVLDLSYSKLLNAMGIDARAAEPGARVYQILDSGQIVPAPDAQHVLVPRSRN